MILKKEVNGVLLEDRLNKFIKDISEFEEVLTSDNKNSYSIKNNIVNIYLDYDYDCAVMEQDKQFNRISVDYNISYNQLSDLIKNYDPNPELPAHENLYVTGCNYINK